MIFFGADGRASFRTAYNQLLDDSYRSYCISSHSFMRADMSKHECPDRIYKFLDFNGLCKTLESGTIRLSKPNEFNDPLDIYLQECFGKGRQAFFEDMKGAFQDFIEGELDLSSLPDSPYKAKITAIITAHKKASPEQRAEMREEMSRIPIEELYDLKKLEETEREVLSWVNQSFEFDGAFCSTVDFKNLLMWAHYADKHQGAAIEFTPNKEKDSAFLASRKVIYSNERPVLYATAQEMIISGIAMSTEESGKSILDKLIYTKGRDWEYEQEYRLVLPFCIKPGQPFATHSYHPEELTSVLLGCRMSQQNQEKAIALARTANPLVAIYKAYPTPREFGLSFAQCL